MRAWLPIPGMAAGPGPGGGRAIRCYTKVGFRPVGVMRQYERGDDGRFHDGLLMDPLRGELRCVP